MKKRLLAMLLSAVMIISLLPTAAFAADEQTQTAQTLSADAVQAVAVKTAAGEALKTEMEDFQASMEKNLQVPGEAKLNNLKANIQLIKDKWEDASAEPGTDYDYDMTANTLTVKTAAGLAWMAKQINDGFLKGTAVTLANDIDLSGKLWTPAQDFTGTFDGQEHTITGLTINNEAFKTEAKFVYLGLFQNIDGSENARSFVKNVTFKNVSVYAPRFKIGNDTKWPSFGTVAGYSDYTDYENITVSGTVTLYAENKTAGVVVAKEDDSTGNSFCGCKVNATTVYSVDDFYGIVCYTNAGTLIENCSVRSSFYVNGKFAGIASEVASGSTIRNCSVSGDLYAHNTSYGICYKLGEYDEKDEQNVMADCSVALNAWVYSSFFGLSGATYGNSTTTNCHVSGTFYIGSDFCGLMEYLYDGGTVEKCSVSGKVYADGGGAAGFDEVHGSDEGELKAAEISGIEVDLTAYYRDGQAGGLSIETCGNVNISDCTVAGEIYSLFDENFGGIVSDAGTDSRQLDGGKQEDFGTLTVNNCSVPASLWRGDIADSANGGIVGDANCDNLTITSCTFAGGLYMATMDSYYAGGLIGDASSCGGTLKVTGSNVTCDVLCVAESIWNINVGGLIGGDSGWSAEQFNLENCHFKGNLVVKVTDEKEMRINRIGALAACLDADNLTVNNCSAESQIILDGRQGDGSLYHGGAMFGGLKYPDYGTVSNCTFTGDVTALGNADNLLDIDHFGMIVGEDCSKKFVLSNIVVDGDFHSDYAEISSYFGGAVGHRCCDNDMTATNVSVNTNVTMTHSGDIEDFGGFLGNAGSDKLVARNCTVTGDIAIEMLPPKADGSYYTISQLGGFLGDDVGESEISRCSHTGDITISNADIENLAGFAAYIYSSDNITITDSYTFGNITVNDGTLNSNYGVGQWIGEASASELLVKNCYSVGDLTINAAVPDDSYIGNVCGYVSEAFTLDNYYHAGTLTVNSSDGAPSVGYLTGDADEICTLTNVYYDEENFAASTSNDAAIKLALGDNKAPFLTTFVPLATAQMQANRYDSDESYKKLDGAPAVAEPSWDYLNGETYANEIEKKAPLVDALNAGKDGYLNWRVDGDSFRGYPFFGKSYTILYYVDFGNGYELQNIEQFDKTGTTAKDIPVPDQTLYPNSAYEWQDQNGVSFTGKTILNGDKMVYAKLISYYTVKYVTNYPDKLVITPTDHDILENNYMSGATVTVRSNNTFTVPNGYRFKEWNTEADGSGTKVDAFSTQTITDKNLVFYAIWEPLPEPTYSVYYVANGGNGDMWDSSVYHSGDDVTVKANAFVHPEGLEFTGFLEYETQKLYQPGSTFNITRDTYLIAQWKVPTYTVTYLPGEGGQGSMTDDTAYESGDEANIKANTFTRDGYEFAGFVDLDNNQYKGDGTESITVTKDVVLTAQWTPVKYTVTYHGNGAAEKDVVDSDYLYDTPVTIRDGAKTFTKANSTFLYWSLKPDGEKEYGAGQSVNIKANIDLYAIWETNEPEETFSVTYKPNGASGSDVIDGNHASGATVSAKDGSIFSRANYTFQYWSLTADGSKAYSPNDTITIKGNIVLYAIWSKNSGGGSGGGGGGGSSTPSTGTVNIIKTDSADKQTYLSGAKFEIYSSADKLIGTYTTDDKGQIKVEKLATGKYYAVEITPPTGYTLDSSKHEFTITGGKTTSLTLTNKRTGVPDMLNGDDHFAYIIGRDDGLVHPEAPITRAEVTTIFFRLLTADVRDGNLSKTNAFSDVNQGMWFNTAISTMSKLGIVHGRTNTTFEPNAYITRAEFAAIAARFDKSTSSQSSHFSDISGHWAEAEINKAAANGWVNGYSDGTFKPDQNITRAEAMALINRVLNRSPETTDDLHQDMIKWPDALKTDAWYYLDVQEATNSHDYNRKTNGCETWTKLTKVPDWKSYEIN